MISADVFTGVIKWFMEQDKGTPGQIAPVIKATPQEVTVALGVLKMLGLGDTHAQKFRLARPEHARLILHSLLSFGTRPVLGDLEHEGNERTWVRVLRALESRRLSLDGQKAPMQHTLFAVALIVGMYRSQRYVLIETGHGLEGTRYGLPGGPGEPGSYSIRTIEQHLREEIQPDIQKCLALNGNTIQLDAVEPDVDRGALTHFDLVVFGVDFYKRKRLNYRSDPKARNIKWMSLSSLELRLRLARRTLTAALAHEQVRKEAALTPVVYPMDSADLKRLLD